MANNPDDLENFDDSQFDDLDTELDASYDEPLPGDLSADLMNDQTTEDVVLDDDFGTDDNWDDQGADAQYDEPQPQKKKSSLLTYGIIGLVVLGGAGFALSKMGGTPAPVAPEVPVEAAQNTLGDLRNEAAKESQLETPTPDVPPPAAPPEGFMNEDAPALPVAPTMTAVDTPVSPPVEALPVVPAPPAAAELPADPAVIGGLKPVSDFPSVDQIKKSETTEVPAAAIPPVAAELPVPETPPTVAAEVPTVPVVNKAEMTVLQGKLDAAQSKIDALEKDLAAAKMAADASKSDAQVAELEEKVASLEKKLATQEDALKDAKQAEKSQPAPVKEDVSTVDEEPVVTTAARPAPAKTGSATPSKPVSWDLRGAQPGKAMLSKKGSEDVRTVSVGDTLPGLGKIISISQGASGWIVRGTQGSVTQ